MLDHLSNSREFQGFLINLNAINGSIFLGGCGRKDLESISGKPVY
ncbi:hypothetical protein [Candidatus Nitrosocosmicus hydrocola]|nr:hypothetical protein [Candidatus Nitrosocosmicus hydrocola]